MVQASDLFFWRLCARSPRGLSSRSKNLGDLMFGGSVLILRRACFFWRRELLLSRSYLDVSDHPAGGSARLADGWMDGWVRVTQIEMPPGVRCSLSYDPRDALVSSEVIEFNIQRTYNHVWESLFWKWLVFSVYFSVQQTQCSGVSLVFIDIRYGTYCKDRNTTEAFLKQETKVHFFFFFLKLLLHFWKRLNSSP